MLYNGEQLALDEVSVECMGQRIDISGIENRVSAKKINIKTTTPIIEKLIETALYDIETNIVKLENTQYFGAGREFGAVLFLRDISYSGLLSLNRLYPQEMLDSLKYVVQSRLNTGFGSGKDYIIKEIQAPWYILDNPNQKGLSNPVTRRTDDVIWIWCAADLLEQNKELSGEWEWFYKTGVRCFNEIYNKFYDEKDSLFHGQASFIDIHFPDIKASGYPLEWDISDCVLIKATSTNSIYKIAMDKMSLAAGKLGLQKEADFWKQEAEKLKEAMLKGLMLENGAMSYFKDRNGHLEQRSESLGTALAVLGEIVVGAAAEKMLKLYPVTEKGVPLLNPFFDFENLLSKYNMQKGGNYHNNTSWPFVDEFYFMALEKIGKPAALSFNIALMARTCIRDGSFCELIDYRTNMPIGSSRQLWTASAFLNVCIRAGII